MYHPFENGGGASFEQTWIPFTQECFVPSLVEISPVVLKKKIFKILLMYFKFAISLLSPVGKGQSPLFE